MPSELDLPEALTEADALAKLKGIASKNVINKMKEGFYYFIKFESEDASTPNELEASLRIFEPVVRYLIVRDEAVEQPAQAE